MKQGNETPRGTGREFMEKTKYRYIGASDQQRGVPQPPLEVPAAMGKPIIDLTSPISLNIARKDLRTAIEQRQSIRHHSLEPLTLEELSFLLGARRA